MTGQRLSSFPTKLPAAQPHQHPGDRRLATRNGNLVPTGRKAKMGDILATP